MIPEQTPIRDPAQLGLDLRPGKREPAQPKLTWKPWSPEEQFAIDVNDGIGTHSRGRMVEVHS